MASTLRDQIIATAQSLGINPLDLATAISYETAGTFDPLKRGPTTKWGQHRGLIQFGEPQAQKYGVDWSDPLNTQLGPDGAVAKYLRDTGVKPGMGLMDVYSAINAGGVGRYDRSDAQAGGAPGTVADKVNNQMAGHRQKAEQLFAGVNFGSMAPQPSPTPRDPPVASYPSSVAPTVPATTQQNIPAAVQAVAGAPTANKSPSDVFGMLAMMGSQPTQFSPVQTMGPSPEQSAGLLQLVQALKSRIA